MALIVFAITLFVAPLLLFLVQPMIGKMILPKLGGTPQVWNTCMLFFQTVLLAGYFYTHATTTYLKPRKQMILHGLLMFLPLIVMLSMGRPFDVRSWVPPVGSNPIFAALYLLLIIVGVPFFVVSTSAPLLQKWFSFSGDPTAKDPYFLYGASNFGSLLSLGAYPFLVEPWFEVGTQTWIWFAGYIGLMILFFGAAAIVWKEADNVPSPASESPAPESVAPDPLPAQAVPTATSTAIQPSRMVGKKKGLKGGSATAPSAASHVPSVARRTAYDPQAAPVTVWRCIRWALLAAVPSSLMLGVTSYVSTDLSPFPLLWAIPLSLYLLSFILVFARWPIEWTKEPHTLMLWMMPFFVIILCGVLVSRSYAPTLPTFGSFAAFFIITMALHGELAKDRPSARQLTLFFLMMSFGGMLGGLFNAMVAPVVFTGIVEYPLAIMLACFLRPNFADKGWLDGAIMNAMPDLQKSLSATSDNFAVSFGQKPTGTPFVFTYFMDVVIGVLVGIVAWVTTANATSMVNGAIGFFRFLGMGDAALESWYEVIYRLAVYGLPVILTLCVMARKIRFAIAIVFFICFAYFWVERSSDLLVADRSYYGVLRIQKDNAFLYNDEGKARFVEVADLQKDKIVIPFNFLMHGSTYHGRNYQDPELSRLATTYYHRLGPVGCIMERFNWFPGKQNTYAADARMPVSLIGFGCISASGAMNLPLDQIADVWSEPPFATVGLGTGTMASYVRPLQHMTYYEIDDKIKTMSVREDKLDPKFLYVKEAGERGGDVEIVMGDARLSLEKEDLREKQRLADKKGGPSAMRDNYYHAIILDAFSSDAIPVHLITKEAVELYMQKLAPKGVLLVHTSNRHLNLVDPVADIAASLGLDAWVGHDNGGARDETRRRDDPRRKNPVSSLGHFSSEYIMLARKGVLDKNKLDNAIGGISLPGGARASTVDWRRAAPPNRSVWTDQYQNIVSIMR